VYMLGIITLKGVPFYPLARGGYIKMFILGL
jgi:hypothetical protein